MTDTTAEGVVLDAWILLEWMQKREPASTILNELQSRAKEGTVKLSVSRMNYGEVQYSVRKRRAWSSEYAGAVLQMLATLPIEVVSVADAHVDRAAALKSLYNISYADGFAAALSEERGWPLVTGDPEFRALEADKLLVLIWAGA